MAKSNNDDNFLGGAMKFNSVGVGKRASEAEAATEEGSTYKVDARTIGIILIVLVLAVMLYFVAEKGFGGVQIKQGTVHSQPTDTGAPPSNF